VTTVIFDSHRLGKRLVGKGFEEKQAEALWRPARTPW
jgi:hypothetical protein